MARSDRGSTTAELAVALPALMILLLAGAGAIAAVTEKLGCVADARDAALAAARGDDVNKSDVTVTIDGDKVVATARRTLRVTTLICTATAPREPGP